VGLLSESEYHASLMGQMTRVPQEEPPSFDFWPYFESIPTGDFEGFDCSAGRVEYVYRESAGRFEHVLVDSNDKNVFMVLVLDRVASKVQGHRLLNLRREYGLDAPGAPPNKRLEPTRRMIKE